ncbi:MAG: pilus assembly protein PilP [Betaproteobacteria bacterium]
MKTWRLAPVLLGCAVLAGCGATDQEELHKWMGDQRNQIKAGVAPISAPKKFVPQAYTQGSVIDPYSLQRLAQSVKHDLARVADNAALLAPELARRKEALESFPLDSVVMVGSLIKAGQPVGLVRVENLLYPVREGNHLGQNYGRITKIGETELSLREIAQDASGEWIERSVKLQLLESSKK